MSVTIGSLEQDVREILIDTYPSGYRWSPYVLFCGLRDGIKRLNSVRPESRYFGLTLVKIDFPAVDGSMTAEEIETVRDTVVLVEEKWHEAVVFYALHKAYMPESPDTANAKLSAYYLSLFERIAAS
jgi:hypothetical protein